MSDAVKKFDPARAAAYDRQARIALAGYEAMHELGACCLAAALGAGGQRSLLVVGVGTGQEIVTIGALEPAWRFTAVDPSASMIAIAQERLGAAGLLDRTELVTGEVAGLSDTRHDGATLIGVLHHLSDAATRVGLLRDIAQRLGPGAPLILGGNFRSYAREPLLLAAWKQRWRQQGIAAEDADAQFARIVQGVVPPDSEAEVHRLLAAAGFTRVTRFFNSLFWGGWVAFRDADQAL
ncbi:MAG TPA: class I SAM-dependent methyltransferase [Aliidongia sp.]|uniref:class I SAM-dependent methyltransferase n=1 Tax=Aliidongia sp. TaxID=1914230 RepID=UPI002DDDABFC|nr:class I SAM-dependent methyltransferase [Aliidongia sp.]HEV2674575.1 class I SAM-dependent methyltransferase [Aliidongia sp.]